MGERADEQAANDVPYWQDRWKRRGLAIERLRNELAASRAEAARYFSLLDFDTAQALSEAADQSTRPAKTGGTDA